MQLFFENVLSAVPVGKNIIYLQFSLLENYIRNSFEILSWQELNISFQ